MDFSNLTLKYQLPQATVPLLKLVIGVLISWHLAALFWQSARPTKLIATSSADLTVDSSVTTITSMHLFGQSVPVTSNPSAVPAQNIVIRGLLANRIGKKASAIIAINGAPNVVVIEGSDIAPGTRLDRVYSDRIDVTTPSGRLTIVLPK